MTAILRLSNSRLSRSDSPSLSEESLKRGKDLISAAREHNEEKIKQVLQKIKMHDLKNSNMHMFFTEAEDLLNNNIFLRTLVNFAHAECICESSSQESLTNSNTSESSEQESIDPNLTLIPPPIDDISFLPPPMSPDSDRDI